MLARQLVLRGYQATQDVRAKRLAAIVRDWALSTPILLISGESGQGKSWLLYGFGQHIPNDGQLCVLVWATGIEAETRAKGDETG